MCIAYDKIGVGLSEGEVQPNDFFDLPLWRRLLAQAVERVRGRAA